VEEPATPGCSWTGAVGGRSSQGGGRRVSALDDGVAMVIDLTEFITITSVGPSPADES
jgi:hypothetical protein